MSLLTTTAKILIVDDEPKIRQLYKKLLFLVHYVVLEAEDGRAAIRLLAEEKNINLILLDINMPVVDGSILYRMIRTLDRKIRVLVTSAHSVQDQKNKIDDADDYYDKSQGTEQLLEKIKNLL